MPHYDSTADVKKLLAYARGRVAFKSGGKVTKKTTMGEFSKGKRLRPGIRLKGGKSFIEEYRRRLNKKADGGRIGLKEGGSKYDTEWVYEKVPEKQKDGSIKWVSYGKPKEKKTEAQLKSDQLFEMELARKNYKAKKDRESTLKARVKDKKADGGRIEFKKGGKADKKWIQKATKGMRKDKPCTGKKFGGASCPPGSKRYNLAKTFKKMGKARKA